VPELFSDAKHGNSSQVSYERGEGQEGYHEDVQVLSYCKDKRCSCLGMYDLFFKSLSVICTNETSNLNYLGRLSNSPKEVSTPPPPLQALVVPVIELGAGPRAGASSAASPANTAALAPALGSAAGRGRSRSRGGGGSSSRSRERGARHAAGDGGGGRGAGAALDAVKPVQVVLAVDGDIVGDAGAVDAHQVLAVDVLGVAGRRSVGKGLLRRAVGVAEDTTPLLQGLVEILMGELASFLSRRKRYCKAYLRIDGGIGRPMVDHHLGTRPGVAGVHVESRLGPNLLRGDGLAVGAGAVPSGNGTRVEAASGHTGIGGSGLEEIGIGGGKDVGHHGAGARAGNEDAVTVGIVSFNGPPDHLGNTGAAAAAIAGEGRPGRHIPAATAVGRLGIDDDETVLIGETGIGGAGIEGVGGAGAVVDGSQDGRVCLEPVRDVDVHAGPRRVGAEVGDLGQGGGIGNRHQAQETRGKVVELHVVRLRGRSTLGRFQLAEDFGDDDDHGLPKRSPSSSRGGPPSSYIHYKCFRPAG